MHEFHPGQMILDVMTGVCGDLTRPCGTLECTGGPHMGKHLGITGPQTWVEKRYQWITTHLLSVNILRPRQNAHHFPDNIFLNENARISINFVPYGPIDYKQALVQIMAWCRPGDKPLSQPMMAKITEAYICISEPQ